MQYHETYGGEIYIIDDKKTRKYMSGEL